MFQYRSSNSQQGQALLIVILVMVVALTIGLSVASRTITNIRNTEDEEQSQAALSAAEAGIEEFIKQPCASGTCTIQKLYSENRTADVVVTVESGAQVAMNNGNPLKKDEGGDIWLVPHNADGTPNWNSPWPGNNNSLTVYWGDTTKTDCQTAALEIILVEGTINQPQTTHYVYDSCPARRGGNAFLTPDASGSFDVDGKDFKYNSVIVGINQGLIARVVPLYNSTIIGFRGSSPLPSQERRIESVGNAGDTKRKVRFVDRYPELPSEMFQYLQFSTY